MESFIYYNKIHKILEYRKTAEILFSRHALKDRNLTQEDIDFAVTVVRHGKLSPEKSNERVCFKNYFSKKGKTYFVVVEDYPNFIKIITVIKKKGKY